MPSEAALLLHPASGAVSAVQCRVVLCADDYGISDGVSEGILQLLEQGRISATSAMTNLPGWPRHAAALADARARRGAGIGLHLNLTCGRPLRPMPLLAPGGRLPSLGGLLRRLMAAHGEAAAALRAELAGEIRGQLDAFTEACGQPPDFVDGHQHVQVLPAVRSTLLLVLRQRGLQPWLRDPGERLTAVLMRAVSLPKALVVGSLALGFGAAARRAGFVTNQGFSGFSPLRPETEPGAVFAAALARLGPRPLVMCHPGHADAALRRLDRAVESRPRELAYLASEEFAALLEERRIALVARP